MVNIEEDFKPSLLTGNHSQANVYGFVLFTEEHYNVVKAMRDTDFWAALNKLSGDGWPIFSVYPLQPKIEEYEGGGPSGTISWMRCISKETEYNKNALEFFGLMDSVKDLPCFIIFALDKDSKNKIYQKTFTIGGNTEADVKQSLTDIVRAVTDIETNIRMYGSKEELSSPFAAWEASKSLERLEVASFIRKNIPLVSPIVRFIASFG